jgi:restriction endonuclease S subunit
MGAIRQNDILNIEIPLPPLEIQEQIVKEIEGYQQIIDGCMQVVENYKPVIDIDPSWNMVKISDIAEINPKKTEICNNDLKKTASFVPMKDLNEFNIYFNAVDSMNVEAMYSKGYSYFKDSDVLLAKVTPCFENGKSGIAKNLLNGFGFGSTEFYVFRANENTLDKWIYYNIVTNKFINDGINNFTGTSGLRRVPKDFVSNYQIPLPDIQTQKVIVEKLEQERNVVDGNKELIKIYEDKINARINKVWSDN